MNPHDPNRIVYPPARQFWRAFAYAMQVHENHCIKRAGVAGLRARAACFSLFNGKFFEIVKNFLAIDIIITKV